MATWQFHIYFIPQKALLHKYGYLPDQLKIDKESWSAYISNSDLDEEPAFEDALTISWWLDLDINKNDFLPLLKPFGDIQKWTEQTNGIRSFGDSRNNDITVCFNDNTHKVEEVSCRIDLRLPDKNFIGNVLSLAIKFECLLMDRQGRLYQPTTTALLETIKLSNASRFVENPEQFLENLTKGMVAPQ